MNGIEKITARIAADAENAAAEIRGNASSDAEEIRHSFEREAEQVRKGIIERGSVKAKEREEGLISLAQMETKKMVLAAKQEVLDAAFDLAAEKLQKMPKAEKLAKRIAAQAPIAVRYAKNVINNGYDMDMKSASQYEVNTFSISFSSEDMKEGTKAFLEKRKPEWKNR